MALTVADPQGYQPHFLLRNSDVLEEYPEWLKCTCLVYLIILYAASNISPRLCTVVKCRATPNLSKSTINVRYLRHPGSDCQQTRSFFVCRLTFQICSWLGLLALSHQQQVNRLHTGLLTINYWGVNYIVECGLNPTTSHDVFMKWLVYVGLIFGFVVQSLL